MWVLVDKQRCSLPRSEGVADNSFTTLLAFPAKWPSLLPGLFNRNRTKVLCPAFAGDRHTEITQQSDTTQRQTTGQGHSHDSLQVDRDSDSCGRQTEGRRHKESKSGLGLS